MLLIKAVEAAGTYFIYSFLFSSLMVLEIITEKGSSCCLQSHTSQLLHCVNISDKLYVYSFEYSLEKCHYAYNFLISITAEMTGYFQCTKSQMPQISER
jgi:hypothetical protein